MIGNMFKNELLSIYILYERPFDEKIIKAKKPNLFKN